MIDGFWYIASVTLLGIFMYAVLLKSYILRKQFEDFSEGAQIEDSIWSGFWGSFDQANMRVNSTGYFLGTWSYIAQTGLQLGMFLKMAMNF